VIGFGRSGEAFMPATPIEERLADLHAHYVRRINASVAAGRLDLVRELADEYEDDSLELMLALEGGTASQPDYGRAEIRELGGPTPFWHAAGRPGTWRFRFWRRSSR
jgi:hypothetical protein